MLKKRFVHNGYQPAEIIEVLGYLVTAVQMWEGGWCLAFCTPADRRSYDRQTGITIAKSRRVVEATNGTAAVVAAALSDEDNRHVPHVIKQHIRNTVGSMFF